MSDRKERKSLPRLSELFSSNDRSRSPSPVRDDSILPRSVRERDFIPIDPLDVLFGSISLPRPLEDAESVVLGPPSSPPPSIVSGTPVYPPPSYDSISSDAKDRSLRRLFDINVRSSARRVSELESKLSDSKAESKAMQRSAVQLSDENRRLNTMVNLQQDAIRDRDAEINTLISFLEREGYSVDSIPGYNPDIIDLT